MNTVGTILSLFSCPCAEDNKTQLFIAAAIILHIWVFFQPIRTPLVCEYINRWGTNADNVVGSKRTALKAISVFSTVGASYWHGVVICLFSDWTNASCPFLLTTHLRCGAQNSILLDIGSAKGTPTDSTLQHSCMIDIGSKTRVIANPTGHL